MTSISSYRSRGDMLLSENVNDMNFIRKGLSNEKHSSVTSRPRPDHTKVNSDVLGSVAMSPKKNKTKKIQPLGERNLNLQNASTQVNVGKTPESSDEKHTKVGSNQIKEKARSSKHISSSSSGTSSNKTNSDLEDAASSCVIEEVRRGVDGKQTYHKYLRGKMLGKGGFAKVYWCTSLDTQRNYAIKIVPKTNLVKVRARQKLQTEIKIHRTLKHKRVCEFKHFFEDRINCYIVLEICQNQTMNELIKRRKRLTELEVVYYMLQLIDGLHYLHSNNVIHRDLKLGNLFLDDDMGIKIGDFGLASKLVDADEKRMTICGTPNYIAPEVIDSKKKGEGHSFQVDMWALGVIMYATLFGKPPYEAKDVKSTYQRILNNEYSFPEDVAASDHAKSLIHSLLQTEPENRPSLSQVRMHPFFSQAEGKLPLSLPSISTHTAPVWQTDASGNLVPVIEHHKPSSTFSLRRIKTQTGLPLDGNRRPLSNKDINQIVADQAEQIVKSLSTNNNIRKNKGYYKTSGKRMFSKPSNKFAIYNDEEESDAVHTESRDQVPEAQKQRIISINAGKKNNGYQKEFITTQADNVICEKLSKATLSRLHSESTKSETANSSESDRSPVTQVQPVCSRTMEVVTIQSKEREGEPEDQVEVELTEKASEKPPRKPLTQGYFVTNSGAVDAVFMQEQEGNVLESMHNRLTQSFSRAEQKVETVSGEIDIICSPPPKHCEPAKIWVTRYVDYTSKYGLGFLLNNGSAGVYFNDSTKIIIGTEGDDFQYIERKKPSIETDNVKMTSKEPSVQTYTLNQYPEDLKKKVTLLKHFRGYLLEQEPREGEEASSTGTSKNEELVYLKKWIRTRHAILFRLSNRTVQVVFYDRTEVILSSEARIITYVDKDQKRSTHSVHEITSYPSCDIAKRLKYSMDILQQMLTGSKNIDK